MTTQFQLPPSAANKTAQRHETAATSQANSEALRRAFARGEASKLDILQRPDMLNGEALAAQLGLSRATVDNRRVAGKLLALDFGSKRGVRYPDWQCELLMHERETFEKVLGTLAQVGPWSRYRFFTQPTPALGGVTPVEALQAGQSETVLKVAHSWAAGEQGGG